MQKNMLEHKLAYRGGAAARAMASQILVSLKSVDSEHG
jgi:hypothetical protein